ncbi:MAG TPA: UDP-N-acetylglucosamine 1-carboxyvinyltransferase, partial [Candidatus Cloacimonas sp.]|nr:UDP-N-acetylglucosamine 1-carboxyvinyltransferase [Candidatus Cloacimonas sp.]
LVGTTIEFPKVSVGATANVLMAAVLAKGTTILKNAAKEPEIGSLIEFLNLMGAKIKGKDTSVLEITGVSQLQPAEMKMIPDRIETGTFMIAAAITGSEIKITHTIPKLVASLTNKLELAGVKIEQQHDSLHVLPNKKIIAVNISTQPYPGFPTDLQAQFMALMCLAEGTSKIEENIFPDRFMHVAELKRLDADIQVTKNLAIIQGVSELSGAPVMATDLRASAALVLAGLAAKGETVISRIYHIDRGYEKIEEKLQALGADIKRVKG